MRDKSRVILNPDFWDRAKQTDNPPKELKRLIGNYMAKSYPNYTVLEVHKYYAICYIGR